MGHCQRDLVLAACFAEPRGRFAGVVPYPTVSFAMRIPASMVANVTAWAVLICLIAVAFVAVVILGPFGLIVLGLLTLFVCTSVSLREDAPTWGNGVFRSRMAKHNSPEQRAAVEEARRLSLAPLRFYRWCGIILLLAGVAGFAWQQLH
jgi:hypothetical protein